ncbi:inositol monophosphatase family protein [Salinarimonas rosea]|uniref:inositol monophosphatase family protein n=1 Tax=Salinarimonas rosea TaxID=552063 RepID=UPI00040C83C8|nr:inositol monophosphatase [Salinarimonas rosea]
MTDATDPHVAYERGAIVLARLAGAEIVSALGGRRDVRYKTQAEGAFLDPVSEVDHGVETLIHAILAERFPDHGVLGEELTPRRARGSDVVWAVDPVDGTTNFVNGFPLFCASIGVLEAGRPVAGALWCSTSHALRAGVYHAREGGALAFDETPLDPAPDPAVRRRLAGTPEGGARGTGPFDLRKTGSAALECAFVAAGLLAAARFAAPNVWDVAGGIALVRAGGGAVRHRPPGGGWVPLERFEAPDGDLARWRGEIAVGSPEALDALLAQG